MNPKVKCAVPTCESRSETLYAARANGWTYANRNPDNFDLLCPAHGGWKPEAEAPPSAADQVDEDRYADIEAVDRKWRRIAMDLAHENLIEASRRNALWRATVERVCIIIGFEGYRDSTQMFKRLRELVAKEGKQ